MGRTASVAGSAALLVFAGLLSPAARAADWPGDPLPLSPESIAEDPRWSFTVFGGASGGGADLGELLLQPWLVDGDDYLWIGAAAGRQLGRFWDHFTVEAEIGLGHRSGPGFDASEAWLAAYLRYDNFPWNRFVRTTVAVSTGLSVIDDFPAEELEDEEEGSSKLLHYFSPEVTFALPEHEEHELVLRYHHRSGIFGTFGGVRGGSNVLALGYRYRW